MLADVGESDQMAQNENNSEPAGNAEKKGVEQTDGCVAHGICPLFVLVNSLYSLHKGNSDYVGICNGRLIFCNTSFERGEILVKSGFLRRRKRDSFLIQEQTVTGTCQRGTLLAQPIPPHSSIIGYNGQDGIGTEGWERWMIF